MSFASFFSCTWCSPRTIASTGPSSPTTQTFFDRRAAGRPVSSTNSSMVPTPGVSKGSGASGGSPKSGSWATETANSTFAA
jgi:hypothetical protein